jgi:threonine dehydrogenase-like Zn-dependent dehydrogenase
MKAVVFHDIGDIRLDDVPDPEINEPTDAIVRLTASRRKSSPIPRRS